VRSARGYRNRSSTPPPRIASSWRHPPLWLRWVLALLAFGVLAVSVVVGVRAANKGGVAAQRSADAEANRLARIVQAEDQAEDQAPHSASLDGRQAPQRALERVIVADLRQRIARNELSGPLGSVRCRPTARLRRTRHAFCCTVVAGDFPYPFLGVVDLRAQRATWCKYDPGAIVAYDVPVSRRCTA
jgi:hypothetical protein